MCLNEEGTQRSAGGWWWGGGAGCRKIPVCWMRRPRGGSWEAFGSFSQRRMRHEARASWAMAGGSPAWVTDGQAATRVEATGEGCERGRLRRSWFEAEGSRGQEGRALELRDWGSGRSWVLGGLHGSSWKVPASSTPPAPGRLGSTPVFAPSQ